MKLIEDDGEIIEEFDDDTVVILLRDDPENPYQLITPSMDDCTKVPEHILLGGAVIACIDSPHGREQVMGHLPPMRRN